MALKPTLLRPPLAQTHFWWYRNFLPCFPSLTPFGLSLGTDLPWADEPSPGNLRLSANGILTRFIATDTGIISSLRSTCPRGQASLQKRMLPYRCPGSEDPEQPVDSVAGLSPVGFSARNHLTSELLRTLSMMAASKPTSWLSKRFHIFSHLARTWGPYLTVWAVSLSTTKLIPRGLTSMIRHGGIRSLVGFGKLLGSLAHSVLYPHRLLHEASPKAISGRTSYFLV